MDWLKNTPLKLALCLIGTAFIYLSLAGKLAIWTLNLEIAGVAFRAVAFAAGALFVAGAVWLEILSRAPPLRAQVENAAGSSPQSADTLFYSLDDPSSPKLRDRLDGAKRISLLVRSGVSIFAQYESLFVQLGKDGCEFRVILVDPRSPVAKSLYGGDDISFETYAEATFSSLRRMRNVFGKSLSVRLIPYAPTVSLMFVEQHKQQDDNMQVTFLFTHTLYGRDRPNFTLNKNDRWYGAFEGELKKAWECGSDWQGMQATSDAG